MNVTKPIYVAECIEAGDRFFSLFQTTETNKQQLYETGCALAADWGGECISVKTFKPETTKKAKLWDTITGTQIEVTERRYNNFVKKNPKSTRYDYSRTEFFTETEPLPDDVWDCEASLSENLGETATGPVTKG